MKLINNMIFSWAALSLMTVSCAPEEVYTPGEKDQEGCLGVYFPPQELAGTSLDLDPTAPTTVTLTIARQVPDGEAVVPVEVTGDEVFEVDEISFEDGETETTFQVNFDTAEIGTKYSLSIKVTDPAFASIYSLDAQGISFSVTRVKWNLLTGPAGEDTGLLRDDCFAPMYGIANYEGPVTIYERDDVPGLYRCTPLYSPLLLANAFGYGPSMADQLKAAWFMSQLLLMRLIRTRCGFLASHLDSSSHLEMVPYLSFHAVRKLDLRVIIMVLSKTVSLRSLKVVSL